MGFRVLPRAMSDITSIAAGIDAESPSAARKWLDELYRRFSHLGETPGMGPARPEVGRDVRLFPHGPYVILYRSGPGGVDVVRVIHGKRDPETWL
ncbi:MAG: type II toxin-antitoxin system RelE/ParE family toxin [Bosea sp. (in: a-proteobacteria)]|uniref:type II toxin-antitoxin system RelE/ParE family toxin n=1 Tax=Bosea sp. (in: a-proteobacteria) TaxID=1871050 RepID=UPI002734D08A|nr:type II toxin-antitoxin system RelE/ParE family toxin [Bosea sp. (in: a-proteobacteria)]MDP3257293.1 type II toxin-antitoxin system RelE/ParE family toxin [Bosea sp. (in: a-proteobacteria)]MDP3321446.1 type II toxin-antitoxin system RelE/ParE family toxin [Bosea sp. (in: a-proteobacteria)]